MQETEPEYTGLTPQEISFIHTHRADDVNKLLLSPGAKTGVDIRKMAAQILARQKAVKKIPEWSANEKLLFPPVLSVEQCSSEATARFKASLIGGDTLIDITGGMGIDSYYLSKSFRKTIYIEQNPNVSQAAAYNFAQLGAQIEVVQGDSLETLENSAIESDWIFADPARRGTQNEKVVLLSDCTPDVVSHRETLFGTAPKILLKTSPLLDIDLAVKQLRHVTAIYAVGYEQECKELLFVLERDAETVETPITGVILNDDGKVSRSVTFTRNEEQQARSHFVPPQTFLYEPHAAILKTGAFRILESRFGVQKLSVNSHLYTSETLTANFPGRAFEVVAVCKPDEKEIKKYIHGDKANLTTRNFPGKIQDLRKKWRLKEGGSDYLFATTLEDGRKVVIVTQKIS